MKPTKIIAEIANAHEGRMETLLKMVDVAKISGTDYVKFQLYRAKELVGKDHPKYEEYLIKEYSHQEWVDVAQYCKKINIKFATEIFDEPSVAIVKDMQPNLVKIHSTSISDYDLLGKIANLGVTTLLSVGGSYLEEIQKAIQVLNSKGMFDIVLMQGFQNFPTQIKDLHFSKIHTLKNQFNLPIGIQEHIDGSHIYAQYFPLIAIGMGVEFIEKHFTLNRDLKETDYYSSLNPDEFNRFVETIKEANVALGNSGFELSEEEFRYRNLLKKSIFVNKNLKKGDVLKHEDICFRRTLNEHRLLIDQLEFVLNKTLTKDIQQEEFLTQSHIE